MSPATLTSDSLCVSGIFHKEVVLKKAFLRTRNSNRTKTRDRFVGRFHSEEFQESMRDTLKCL